MPFTVQSKTCKSCIPNPISNKFLDLQFLFPKSCFKLTLNYLFSHSCQQKWVLFLNLPTCNIRLGFVLYVINIDRPQAHFRFGPCQLVWRTGGSELCALEINFSGPFCCTDLSDIPALAAISYIKNILFNQCTYCFNLGFFEKFPWPQSGCEWA